MHVPKVELGNHGLRQKNRAFNNNRVRMSSEEESCSVVEINKDEETSNSPEVDKDEDEDEDEEDDEDSKKYMDDCSEFSEKGNATRVSIRNPNTNTQYSFRRR